MTTSLRALLACALVASVAAWSAQADKPAHAGTKGKKGGPPKGESQRSSDRHDYDVEIRFDTGVRDDYWRWYEEEYGRGNCPPGLAKKNNGCLPPGQAKKRYTIGAPLPSGIVLQPLPGGLARRIGAPPAGYRYGIVDGDVVKLAVGSMLVVDALGGLLD
jgi:Ni/Co efflux regulator RcnB